MVSIETLREQFDELGIEPADEIINKCIEICINNDIIDPVEFVEQWMAYSVSKLGGAEPTIAYLNEMEAHEYTSKTARKAAKMCSITTGVTSIASPRIDTKFSKITTYRNVDSSEQDVLQMYGCITPQSAKPVSRLQQTKNTPEGIRGGGSPFTTVTYSPLSTAPKKADAGAPSKAGQVVYTYGNAQLLKQINWLPSSGAGDDGADSTDNSKPIVGDANFRRTGINVSFQQSLFVSDSSKYMFDSSYDRVMILSDRIYETGNAICHRLAQETNIARGTRKKEEHKAADADDAGDVDESLERTDPSQVGATSSAAAAMAEEDDENDTQVDHEDDGNEWFDGVKVRHVDYPSSEPIRVLGRIVVEPSAATASGRSGDKLAIVDFDEHSLRCTRLDLSKVAIPGWSLFPGQTVLLEGINPRGTLFSVSKVHHERTLTLPRAPSNLERPLTMVVASAPFTHRDDLLYEKLSGLLQYCGADPPDVLLLTGPFADASCPLYAEVAETFDEYFEKIIGTIMGSVSAQTEVLVVANQDDLVASFVYPTLPYKVASFYKNLHFLPDPCLFGVEGIEIGVTTVDVVKHLVEAECTSDGVVGGAGGDKIKRAYNHLFHQASFYPLNPPSEDVALDVDMLNEFGRLNRVPNVMVCPSALNRYVREINGCVCINPSFVDGHTADGSYARLIIHPPDTKMASSSSSQQNGKQPSTSPASYIACQIIKT